MSKSSRRALITGIKPDENIDPDLAEDFIAGRNPREPAKAAAPKAHAPDLEAISPQLAPPPFPGSTAVPPAPSHVVETPAPQPATAQHESNPPSAPSALPRSLAQPNTQTSSHLAGTARVAIGARVRPELAAALKHASLERQLKGIEPFAVQEILEEAIELWLHRHGLLK